MLPRLKSFHKPKTINEALKLLARPGIRTLPLYGGPELFDNLAAAAEMEEVVSLAGLNLDRVSDEDGWLRLGAMTPLAALPDGDLATAAARAYPLNLRQMWTVGAVVAHGGASSPFLVTLLALGARVEVAGQEEQDLSEYLPRRAATDLVAAVIVPSNPDCACGGVREGGRGANRGGDAGARRRGEGPDAGERCRQGAAGNAGDARVD